MIGIGSIGAEAGTVFFQGATAATGNTVAGQFDYWAGGEPNNSSGTEYTLIFAYSGPRWNDGIYSAPIQGYYVEYGGYPEEQSIQDNAGYQVAIPAPVKLEYLDVANNSLFTTSYLFGNLGENYTAPAAPSAPSGFLHI